MKKFTLPALFSLIVFLAISTLPRANAQTIIPLCDWNGGASPILCPLHPLEGFNNYISIPSPDPLNSPGLIDCEMSFSGVTQESARTGSVDTVEFNCPPVTRFFRNNAPYRVTGDMTLP